MSTSQLKDWDNLANLERQVIKQQFQKVVKYPPLPFGVTPRGKRLVGKQAPREQKFAPGNVPQVAKLNAPTGDPSLAFPYTAGKTRVYPRQSEADMRAARENVAAKVANFGLVPTAGGGDRPMFNEMAAMRQMPKRKRLRKKTRVM